MAAAAILNLKNSVFGHVTVMGFNICCSVPNFIKIGRFLTEIWRFNDFQNGGRPLKSDNRSMSYGQKSDIQDDGLRHLEF